ncbi:MAG: cytochrome c3 family protein [Bacteroidota bacterium]
MNIRLMHASVRIMLLAVGVSGRVAFSQDQCFTCHEALGDVPAAQYKTSVHFLRGVSCAGCHGGDATKEDMEEAMNKAGGFIGVPKGDEISKACARCHADAAIMIKQYNSPLPRDQMELLGSSVHGQLSTTGKESIAQCTSCHGVHGILPNNNPRSPVHPLNIPTACASCHSNAAYMHAYDPAMPIDQLAKYRTSVHGKRNAHGDPKTAQCADCHGTHGILSAKAVKSQVYPTNIPGMCARCHADPKYMKGYGIPSDQFKKYSTSVHGKALLEKNDLGAPACNGCHGNHGATPPGVESISKVCGTCHALNAELFSTSPHKKAFDKRKLPECETCHGNHETVAATDALLGVGPEAVCTWCHGKYPDSRAYHVAQAMRGLIDTLERSEKDAQARVSEAEQKGMEIGEAKFKLREIRQARLESRTMVHSFDENKFREVVVKGLGVASVVSAAAGKEIDEYYFRRLGLAISTVIITVVAVSLYLTIRRMERKHVFPLSKN